MNDDQAQRRMKSDVDGLDSGEEIDLAIIRDQKNELRAELTEEDLRCLPEVREEAKRRYRKEKRKTSIRFYLRFGGMLLALSLLFFYLKMRMEMAVMTALVASMVLMPLLMILKIVVGRSTRETGQKTMSVKEKMISYSMLEIEEEDCLKTQKKQK